MSVNETGPLGKVVCAMSGGVDSSVAALLLHRAGYSSIGVSMQVWDYRHQGGCSSRATCCAPDDFTDARSVAAAIGIPYYVVDFEHTFRREVIDRFVQTYISGKTPNPCIDCNSRVKFKELRGRARTFGCEIVATGHYARIESREDGYHLLRGRDADKDQSYFLYGLSQADLSRTLFPVGNMLKSEVREIARQFGLKTAEKPESQDICFVSDSVPEFLVRIGVHPRTGTVVTSSGDVVGEHSGVHNFTVGQRKGLAIGGFDKPQYVLEIRPETNTVVVGPREDLERSSFLIEEVSWCHPQPLLPGASLECMAQLRHRHRGSPVRIKFLENNMGEVHFDSDWCPVSPGQAAVFYDQSNQEVLGGGRIVTAQ